MLYGHFVRSVDQFLLPTNFVLPLPPKIMIAELLSPKNTYISQPPWRGSPQLSVTVTSHNTVRIIRYINFSIDCKNTATVIVSLETAAVKEPAKGLTKGKDFGQRARQRPLIKFPRGLTPAILFAANTTSTHGTLHLSLSPHPSSGMSSSAALASSSIMISSAFMTFVDGLPVRSSVPPNNTCSALAKGKILSQIPKGLCKGPSKAFALWANTARCIFYATEVKLRG
ncbi:hypothetical protein C8F04DRAFT_1197787 [Mycena alexandri]|uniref:Uncharacterized protein n=1 Tax=Mycena alexandri TaxID=1745969 RepID=A0AAD6S5J5_9AGAR|nr:hypothetical protein C8F04DRAFT_1197787 [Mycena alexandri]